MTSILQGNMNRSRLANELLTQICYEKKVDLLIISEQYKNRGDTAWFSDNLGTAAIWVLNPSRVSVENYGAGDGFVWVKSGNITYVSCYFTPNEQVAAFRAKLDGLEDAILEMDGGLVVAGDFNAKALEWGMTVPDSRGRFVMEMASRLGLVVMNFGGASTYRRPGYSETIIDITLASECLASRLQDWRVIEDYTTSDHQYIMVHVAESRAIGNRNKERPARWNVDRMDRERFSAVITEGQGKLERIINSPMSRPAAEELAKAVVRLIQRACAKSMPRKRLRNRRPAYWWTEDIAFLRRKCLYLRRRAQRARKRGRNGAQEVADHKSANKELRRAIRQSQDRCWKKLIEDVNCDPWGLGYKIVTQKLGAFAPDPMRDASVMENIVNELFPSYPERRDEDEDSQIGEIPLFSKEELMNAAVSFKNKKAPGPDGITAEVLKIVVQNHSQVLLDMYNFCLQAGSFFSEWKIARLVLISKGKGPVNAPSSYRPLCMLDTMGKLYERLLRSQLLSAIQHAGDLSDRQYGFRKGRSTVNAVRDVIDAARATERGNHRSRSICLLVTLDVRNAFNSAKWDDMLDALDAFQVPEYLLQVIRDYLKGRQLLYNTKEGLRRKLLTAGTAQGSTLGPDLWNVSYDGLLRLGMPEDTFLVGYADDIAAVVVARDVSTAQIRLNQIMRRVMSSSWQVKRQKFCCSLRNVSPQSCNFKLVVKRCKQKEL